MRKVVAIGLLTDSIESKELYRLTQLLKDTSIKTRWFMRKATQKESIVLDYKKRQAKFYPEDIQWDNSKNKILSKR